MKNENEKQQMSRRKFITLAGAATSFAAISSIGMSMDWALNNPEIDIDSLDVDKINTDVLVVGSGMAGCCKSP